MDQRLIEDVIAHARDRGLTVTEALTHWQLAGGAAAEKASAHWVSIAFGIARDERRRASFEALVSTFTRPSGTERASGMQNGSAPYLPRHVVDDDAA